MCRFEININVSKDILPEATIEGLVEQVFLDTGMRSVPVKIIPIVKFYGFSVFQANMPDQESGYIIVSKNNLEAFNSKKVIVFNSNHSNRRNRFTVAHELAHYIFHTDEEIYAHRDSGECGIEETNANSFASALLMPKKEVINYVKEIKNEYIEAAPNYIIIFNVANEFNVSESAAEVRLRKLGLI